MLFARGRTYLDWAAAAPVTPSAELAFVRALRESGNPSSPHAEGVRAKELLEDARVRIAKLAEAKPDGVIFTTGATEANNLAIQGRVQKLREGGVTAQDIHVLYMPGSHSSVVETVKASAHAGVVTEALLLKDGAIDLEALRTHLRPETKLVVIDDVCGETGAVFDTRSVRTELDRYAKDHGTERPLLHVDATQMPLALRWDLTHLNVDSLALDAQKVGGVRGIGALVMRGNVALAPVMFGGGQERGLRPGTQSPALATAFATALEEAADTREAFALRAERDRTHLIEKITRALPDAMVNAGKKNASHILNLSFPGRDTDYLVMLLDKAGFAVSTRSACETNATDGSRAVLALTSDPERATATLRVSWGPITRRRDLDRFADALIRSQRFLDAP